MVTETIITAATTTLIKSIVDNMRPKIDGFLKSAKIWSVELLNRHEAHFNEYLLRTYERFSTVNTLVFHNSQRQLKDIYVAQTLVKRYSSSTSDDEFYIDRFPADLIRKYNKILISDTAGMGKSTIMKRMFIDLIDTGLSGIGIPIYIELNRLNKDHTILSEIQDELNSLSKDFDKDLLLAFLQTGGFVLFMDGYDEIPKNNKNQVTKNLQDFIKKAGSNNYYIMTSRQEDRLASFGDFREFNIKPLTKSEAYDLLFKYDLSNNKVISTKLIELLNTGDYSTIDEYLENPLLVSLLYIVFDYRQKIPLKKHLFYELVYDALFESHKEAQGQSPHEKDTGLDKDDFNRVLRYMGFECLKHGRVSFEKHEILKIIRNARDFCGNLIFSESSFLIDLLVAVPLFCKDGTEYKWVHKSLLEYFAAMFIEADAKENQDLILTAIYNSDVLLKYENLLDLYFDIDYKGFSKNITLPLCEDFIDFYEKNWVNLKIDKCLIEERVGLLFYYEAYVSNFNRIIYLKYSLYEGSLDSLYYDYQMGRKGFYTCQQLSSDKIIMIEFFDLLFCKQRYILLQLLYRKKRSLFNEFNSNKQFSYGDYDKNRSKHDPRNLVKYIKEQSNDIISINTCEKNKIAYSMINDMLTNPIHADGQSIGRFHSLNYSACIKEIANIKKNLTKPDIINGL